LSANDTVAGETPISAAISLTVIKLNLLSQI